jgi:hypothetical protein
MTLTRTAPLLLTALITLTGCRATMQGTHDMQGTHAMSGGHEMTAGAMTKDGTSGSMSGDSMMKGEAMMKAALSGTFRALHAPTSGSVRLGRDAAGRVTVTITDLKTEPAPDLHVWLLPAGPVTDTPALRDAKYVDLGTIETSVTSRTLTVPDGVNVDGYTNVVLWCDQFSVAFAVAALNP